MSRRGSWARTGLVSAQCDRWRGAAPIQRAIAAGDSQSGMSAMLMDEGLDTGKVLAQQACTIDDTDTAGSLHDKLAKLNAAKNPFSEISCIPRYIDDEVGFMHNCLFVDFNLFVPGGNNK